MPEDPLWSVARIAAEYGWRPVTARAFIRRYRLRHVTTEGPRDTRLYDPHQIRAAYDSRPGRGRRKTPDETPPETDPK